MGRPAPEQVFPYREVRPPLYGGMRQIYIFWLPTLPLTSPPDTAEELSHKEGIKA